MDSLTPVVGYIVLGLIVLWIGVPVFLLLINEKMKTLLYETKRQTKVIEEQNEMLRRSRDSDRSPRI